MIDRELAIEIKEHGLTAIRELTKVLNICSGRRTEEELYQIKGGVGMPIGMICTEVLSRVVYRDHPDLDHIK